MKLPSELYLPGSPKPLGFVDDADAGHVGRASELLLNLVGYAQQIRQPREGKALRVQFCHVTYAPGMPFNLFGFNIWGIDEDGTLVDAYERGQVDYALVVNQPAELQLEVAVSLLMELAGRQRLLRTAAHDENVLLSLPDGVKDSDQRAKDEVVDYFRHGWRAALRAAVEEANSAGLIFEFGYQLDPFPEKRQLDERLPWLRRVYNEIDAVRSMVDKTVSMIGGTPPAIRGGSEDVRAFSQQHLALLDIRRYTNHASRDAEVCGNGYLVIADEEPFAPYCANPESVLVLPNGLFEIAMPSGSYTTERVAHVKGIPQLESPYGLSLLEPFLYAMHRALTLGDSVASSSRWIGSLDLSPEMRRGLEARVDLAREMLDATTQDIERLVQFFIDHVEEPQADLYLPGHEQYKA